MGARPCERLVELHPRLAAERLATELATEPDRIRRLHEHRVAEVVGRLVDRARHGDAELSRLLDLMPLRLDRRDRLPPRERKQEAAAQVAARPRDRVQVVVVCGEDRCGPPERLPELGEKGGEPVRIIDRIGREHRQRVPGAESERTPAMVDRDNRGAGARERAHGGEAVHPAHVGNHSRRHGPSSHVAPDRIHAEIVRSGVPCLRVYPARGRTIAGRTLRQRSTMAPGTEVATVTT